MTTEPEQNLHAAKFIQLRRCPNGWIATAWSSGSDDPPYFTFESTESLARQLVRLLGKSGWKVEASPKRDEKGHFTKEGRATTL